MKKTPFKLHQGDYVFIIIRRNTHSGTPAEGTMGVAESAPNLAFGVVIHEDPSERCVRVTFMGAMMATIYKSAEGEARILELYDRFQKSLGGIFDDRMVDTRFGLTHVLVTGPEKGPPVVVTHGGNSITPQGLRGLLPFLMLGRYRVYAPDTIGHPGKSAQVRLSSGDQSYGEWLKDVLDGLGLDHAAFIGGSFGAGIILRLAAYAPQRITRMALFVPSGIVALTRLAAWANCLAVTIAPFRLAYDRSALLRLALLRLAPLRSAPATYAPLKSALLRLALRKSASPKSVAPRVAPRMGLGSTSWAEGSLVAWPD